MNKITNELIKIAEEGYQEIIKTKFLGKGSYVPWEVLRGCLVTMKNKGLYGKGQIKEVYLEDKLYSYIILIGYSDENTPIGCAILTPEDTKDKAWGKLDRNILRNMDKGFVNTIGGEING